MHAQNRIERAPLEPAHEQFARRGIIGSAADESAEIGCPVGKSGQFKIQPGGNLPLERLMRGIKAGLPADDLDLNAALEFGVEQFDDEIDEIMGVDYFGVCYALKYAIPAIRRW